MPVAIVNQRFASTVWRGEDPVGKRVRLFDGKMPDAWRTVVGVASNIVQNDRTGHAFDPIVYVPFHQRPTVDMALIVRTYLAPGSLGPTLRREIEAVALTS